MKPLALIIFILVQILFIPLAIIGLAMVFYKQMFISRKLGVSATGVDVINGRWVMNLFKLRADAAAAKLFGALPNNSLAGNWLIHFPLYLHFKLTGKNWIYPRIPAEGEEGLAHLVVSRTLYFDRSIARVKDQVEQFVVMGAGYDTRCYGELRNQPWAFFELDQPATQQVKIASLAKAGIDARHVTFVAVDFSQERWYGKLAGAGFDPGKKTLFLWEGVTLYLSQADVCKTIQEMRQHSAAGSVVVADFYSESLVSGTLMPGMKSMKKVLKLTDEELGFGLDYSADYEQVGQDFIIQQGMRLGECHFLGTRTRKGPFAAVVEFFSEA